MHASSTLAGGTIIKERVVQVKFTVEMSLVKEVNPLDLGLEEEADIDEVEEVLQLQFESDPSGIIGELLSGNLNLTIEEITDD